jgi:hypothetical protein
MNNCQSEYKPVVLYLQVIDANGSTLSNATITWLSLKDEIGPTDEFNISNINNRAKVLLPDKGTYLFTVHANGYKTATHIPVQIQGDENENVIHMQKEE